MKINGEFEVKLSPGETYSQGEDGINLARMHIDKIFKGELTAESKGEMLSAMTPTEGSAGYVAIEQVRGSLCGKSGTFVLMHYGVMNRGKDSLILEVVPDSGSGELTGLAGNMKINIKEGQHFYEFEFEF
ncbi:MAG: DUF3224 domain-containing protein [Gammaproteobacteria bacterium]|nr:DUF3224 domain-containing protein [Gammaproteobacteria bacterium]